MLTCRRPMRRCQLRRTDRPPTLPERHRGYRHHYRKAFSLPALPSSLLFFLPPHPSSCGKSIHQRHQPAGAPRAPLAQVHMYRTLWTLCVPRCGGSHSRWMSLNGSIQLIRDSFSISGETLQGRYDTALGLSSFLPSFLPLPRHAVVVVTLAHHVINTDGSMGTITMLQRM